MIHLNLGDGTTVPLNPLHIFAVKPLKRGDSFVMANGGWARTVGEATAQVETWVKGKV